jgi:hypothetical protein
MPPATAHSAGRPIAARVRCRPTPASSPQVFNKHNLDDSTMKLATALIVYLLPTRYDDGTPVEAAIERLQAIAGADDIAGPRGNADNFVKVCKSCNVRPGLACYLAENNTQHGRDYTM